MDNIEVTVESKPGATESCRFHISRPISQREKFYATSQEAFLSPVAKKIFGFPWTEAVRVGPDFVEVTKQNWVDWDVLAEPLRNLIAEHFEWALRNGSHLEENPEPAQPKPMSDPDAVKIQEILETEINPSVAGHGGHISLLEVKGERVFVRLEGGCQGCAQSTATLKQGIEATIQKYLPHIKEVLDVTDHAAGMNPYFVG
jgi:Fe-S cluster biogenesis protein NfuA